MGLAPGVFSSNGDMWRRQRRMVMAGFDPAHVKRYFPSLLEVAQRLAGRWQKAAQQGSVIDLQADLMCFTVDAIAGLAFGAEVNSLESEQDVIQQHLDKIFPALFRRILAPLPCSGIRARALAGGRWAGTTGQLGQWRQTHVHAVRCRTAHPPGPLSGAAGDEMGDGHRMRLRARA